MISPDVRKLVAIRDRLANEVRNLDQMIAEQMPPPGRAILDLIETNFIAGVQAYRDAHVADGCTLTTAKLVVERARNNLKSYSPDF